MSRRDVVNKGLAAQRWAASWRPKPLTRISLILYPRNQLNKLKDNLLGQFKCLIGLKSR